MQTCICGYAKLAEIQVLNLKGYQNSVTPVLTLFQWHVIYEEILSAEEGKEIVPCCYKIAKSAEIPQQHLHGAAHLKSCHAVCHTVCRSSKTLRCVRTTTSCVPAGLSLGSAKRIRNTWKEMTPILACVDLAVMSAVRVQQKTQPAKPKTGFAPGFYLCRIFDALNACRIRNTECHGSV